MEAWKAANHFHGDAELQPPVRERRASVTGDTERSILVRVPQRDSTSDTDRPGHGCGCGPRQLQAHVLLLDIKDRVLYVVVPLDCFDA